MSLMAFIEAGSTQTAFIKGVPLVHENVRIEFELVPQIDHTVPESEIQKFYAEGNRKAVERKFAEVIASRLKKWTFLDEKGNELPGAPPITPEMVLKTKGPLQDRLLLIVYKQSSGGDPDPFHPGTETRSGQQVLGDDAKN